MAAYKLDKGEHSVYSLHYHLVLVIKYRRKAMYTEAIRERLKDIILNISKESSKNPETAFEIVVQEPGEDHHHILFKAKPTTNLAKVVNSIKGTSSRMMRAEFPEIKKFLWGDAFWTPSYFLATTGQVSLDVLKSYVESQQEKIPEQGE
jgi:putative transposase